MTWALDLGTTNTALARWDPADEVARLVVLPAICRDPEGEDPLTAPGVVPSATHVVDEPDLWTRLGRLPLLSRRVLWGRHAYIGQQALERNVSRIHPAFAPGFKAHLQHAAAAPLARLGRTSFSTRDVARAFLRELVAEAQRVTGERLREVVVTAPVDAYEGYRAEVRDALAHIGVKVSRFVDEPVAAAAGYGLSVLGKRRVLVIDMGGGTTDVALVEIDARSVESGSGVVLGKVGLPIGGDLVDRWILGEVSRRLGAGVPEDPFWRRLLLDEARRIKERLYLAESDLFHFRPLGERPMGPVPETRFTRADLEELLVAQELFSRLGAAVDEVLERARLSGSAAPPDDVLMVGGSTLLPGVFPMFEGRFGRAIVRAWQPFTAVVLGACALGARGFAPTDYIVHDYAIVVSDLKSGARVTTPIVSAGTRFPTGPHHWRRSLVPTCPLGVPERLFKLKICEIGTAPPNQRSFGWDDAGRVHALTDGDRLIVPLNEANPTLGQLDPPHEPEDRVPRLDVSFAVDADRWLVATVVDLKTQKTLMSNTPVVRLL